MTQTSRSRVEAAAARLLLILAASAATLMVARRPGVGAQRPAVHDTNQHGHHRPGAGHGSTDLDEPAIAMGTQVVVTGPSGPVQVGPPRLVDNTVSQSLERGAPAGAYTVAWRVTSADGHPVSSTFAFTARAVSSRRPASLNAEPTRPDSGTPDSPRSPLGAWIWAVPVLVVVAFAAAARRLTRHRTRCDDTSQPAPNLSSPRQPGRKPHDTPYLRRRDPRRSSHSHAERLHQHRRPRRPSHRTPGGTGSRWLTVNIAIGDSQVNPNGQQIDLALGQTVALNVTVDIDNEIHAQPAATATRSRSTPSPLHRRYQDGGHQLLDTRQGRTTVEPRPALTAAFATSPDQPRNR